MPQSSSRPQRITNREFTKIETQRKTALSKLICESGLSLSHIARGAMIERRAVRRAVDCEGIRFDTAVRIEYYLNWYNNGGREIEEALNQNELD